MKKEYFRISEVAELTGISRKALIYYHQQKIVCPSTIGENKYRYYTIDQIHQLQIVNMLKEFNTPLKTIRAYIDKKDKHELLALFDKLKQDMQEQLRRTQNYLDILEYKSDLLTLSDSIDAYDDIKIIERKPIRVFCSSELSKDQQDGEEHFKVAYELENRLKELGIIGLGLDTITKNEYLTPDFNNQISYFCVNLNSDRKDLETMVVPGGTYAVTYHKGSHQTTARTYLRLMDYIKENGYEIGELAHEVNIMDYLTEKNPSNYLAEIAIKIK